MSMSVLTQEAGPWNQVELNQLVPLIMNFSPYFDVGSSLKLVRDCANLGQILLRFRRHFLIIKTSNTIKRPAMIKRQGTIERPCVR